MKVLIIDNYDSFTYNLYQLAGDLLVQQSATNILDVYRNDKITQSEIMKKYDRVILSPGPGNPADKTYFGVCAEMLTNPDKNMPVLGVCLGMQGIAHYFGGKVIRAPQPMHGKTSPVKHDNKGVFANIPRSVEVMRYHSLIVDKATLPACLVVSAQTDDVAGEIMGLRHKDFPIEGIQFHPESFATQEGNTMLKNFLFS